MTTAEKNQMIDAQLKVYDQQMFQLEIIKTALLANDDNEGSKGIEIRIEALRKAYKSVELMKEG